MGTYSLCECRGQCVKGRVPERSKGADLRSAAYASRVRISPLSKGRKKSGLGTKKQRKLA